LRIASRLTALALDDYIIVGTKQETDVQNVEGNGRGKG